MGADLAPGFRFCPTDEELLIHYLRPKACGKPFHQGTIAEVDIYNYEPWDLPDKSAIATKDSEWYFFSTQDKKYSHTARINRTTSRGYWKATGKDRKVNSGPSIVGLKKTLIYYEGRAPYGKRTNWIMHEYKLDPDSEKKEKGVRVSVLCRIRKKRGPGPRNGEQYGAPVWNEGDETDEDVKPSKERTADEVTLLHEGTSEKGGNAFNLQNQIPGLESVRRFEPVKSTFNHFNNVENSAKIMIGASNTPCNQLGAETLVEEGTTAPATAPATTHGTCSKGDSESFSDVAYDDISNMCSYGEGGHSHNGFMDFPDLDPLSDLNGSPLLPNLTDFDIHDLHEYVLPAYDEPEILGQMWSLVSEGQLDLIENRLNNGTVESQQPPSLAPEEYVSAISGGGFIELKDMEAPLGEFVLRSPLHGDGYLADSRVPIMAMRNETPLSEGSAAQRVRLQMPSSTWSAGKIKSAVNLGHFSVNKLLPAQKHIYSGSEDSSIPLIKESFKKPGFELDSSKNKILDSCPGSRFKTCSPPHAVESSTSSYLSKHMSSYAVSKFEIAPAEVCYASFTDNGDGATQTSKKCQSSTTLPVKEDKETGDYKLVTSSPDSVLSTSSTEKHPESEGSGFKGLIVPAFGSCYHDCCPDTEAVSVQACNVKAEHVNIRSSRRHRLRTSFKGLMSKWKQMSLGAKLVELEEGMRTKLNERISSHGKVAAKLFRTDDDTSPLERLKIIILATLYNLAMAVLILSCLFWGYRLAMKYTSWVPV